MNAAWPAFALRCQARGPMDRHKSHVARNGAAIQSHFGSKIVLGPNRVVASPGGINAFSDGTYVRR